MAGLTGTDLVSSLRPVQESMQGSSDETANSMEEGSSGPGSSSGHSEGSSNEAGSSRASQSAGSPGSELHSDDMADSEVLKEEEEEEDDEDDDEDEDDEEDEEGNNRGVAAEGSPQKQPRDQPEVRKRKAGEALVEEHGERAERGAGDGPKPKCLPFNPDAAVGMVTAAVSMEGRMRMLDACSARPEGPEQQHSEMGGPSSQMAPGPQEQTCLPCPGDFLGDAMGNELFNCRHFIGPHNHHHHHHHEG